ncbi:hypothetical protein BASA62_003033 [Batrachochytrium salamandrivorans]|nr:hypothetical protein BASA62_003033 [Batrachochytrium salamandrivorans]
MQFFTFFISAITVIASVHGAAIPIMDTPASSQEALETRSYNDPDSGSNLEKRSPGYGRSNFVKSDPMKTRQAIPHSGIGWRVLEIHAPQSRPTNVGPDLLRHLRLHRGAKYIHSPHPGSSARRTEQ